MERTARLVRIVLANLPNTPDPWLRGAADVAAAVGRLGAGSAHEGAHAAAAAGRPGAGFSSRELAHAVLRAGDGSGRREGGASRDVAGRSTGPGRGLSPAASPLNRGDDSHSAPPPSPLRQGGLVGYTPRDVAGRSHATGTSRGLSLAASPLTLRKDSHAAPPPSPLGQGERVGSQAKEAAGGNDPRPARYTSAAAGSHAAGSHTSAVLGSSAVSGSSARHVCPSVHDKDWVLSNDGLGEDGSTQVDVSQILTSLLRSHLGPVRSFRIDSSRWTAYECLEDWIDLLSEKSVQELTLLNLGHKVTNIFPIENLQSKDLRVLRLGFLTLQLDLCCFNYNALQTLDLFCCSIQSVKLSWIVTDCISLKELRVQYCYVDLKIRSSSLEVLHCVGNIGSRLIVEYAPKLQYFVSGVMAKQQCKVAKQKIRALISINEVPSLKQIKHLVLPYHTIVVNTMEITKEIGSLPSLRGLSLSLEMGSASQRQNFLKLLESFPMLEELIVVRLDNIGSDEGFDILIDKPFDDIAMIDCVKDCLTTFSLIEFRGGASEKHLIECLLKNAPNLMQLSTTRCASASKKCIRDASKEIRNYVSVSEKCMFALE